MREPFSVARGSRELSPRDPTFRPVTRISHESSERSDDRTATGSFSRGDVSVASAVSPAPFIAVDCIISARIAFYEASLLMRSFFLREYLVQYGWVFKVAEK